MNLCQESTHNARSINVHSGDCRGLRSSLSAHWMVCRVLGVMIGSAHERGKSLLWKSNRKEDIAFQGRILQGVCSTECVHSVYTGQRNYTTVRKEKHSPLLQSVCFLCNLEWPSSGPRGSANIRTVTCYLLGRLPGKARIHKCCQRWVLGHSHCGVQASAAIMVMVSGASNT